MEQEPKTTMSFEKLLESFKDFSENMKNKKGQERLDAVVEYWNMLNNANLDENNEKVEAIRMEVMDFRKKAVEELKK